MKIIDFHVHLFPDALAGRTLEKLSRTDAAALKPLLRENRDILQQISGRKMYMIRMLYKVFGYYETARLMRILLDMKHR